MTEPLILNIGGFNEPIKLQLGAPINSGNSNILIDTTENWSKKTDYVPKQGAIVIYSDRNVMDNVKYPGLKIGDGLAYVVDLPFVGDDIASQIIGVVISHMSDTEMHVTSEEKAFWNNKLNCMVIGEKLYMTRN